MFTKCSSIRFITVLKGNGCYIIYRYAFYSHIFACHKGWFNIHGLFNSYRLIRAVRHAQKARITLELSEDNDARQVATIT